ncbi:MAG: hypothetical protein EOP11_01765 [Proteobacteria bacterium]|nr:MAG: hypothetical protein EOP11_01765 [Pseudomonadota bacterium]
MNTELRLLTFSIVLGFIQLFSGVIAATAVRGQKWNMGNRDGNEAPLHGVPARLNLAFENFKETFPFFAAAVLLAYATGRFSATTALGAQLYFFARLAYVPIYAAGIPGLRSIVWLVSIAGIALILGALL